ncbi:MAG: TOBE domain-containing protein [Bacillota bacterium]
MAESPRITSVMSKDSFTETGFKKGDKVGALVDAANVILVKH